MDPAFIPLADACVLLFLIGHVTGNILLTRAFVAHRRAQAAWEPDRGILAAHLAGTERGAWRYMAWPCLVGLMATALWRISLAAELLKEPWVMAETGLLVLLIATHAMNGGLYERFQRNEGPWTVNGLRLWSQAAPLLLIAMVLIGAARGTPWYIGALLLALGAAVAAGMARSQRTPTDAGTRTTRP